MAFDAHHGLDDVRLERQLAIIACAFTPSSANLKTSSFRPYFKDPPQTEAQQRDALAKAMRK